MESLWPDPNENEVAMRADLHVPRPEISELSARNLQLYNSAEVAEHYAGLGYLTPCERHMFHQYIKADSRVLEIGVGGGRVSGYLAAHASRYVGIDYAPKMVEACRRKNPGLEFHVGEASDLARFEDGSFDSVVMAFNTIDYVLPDAARLRCLQEVSRVLQSGGTLIFSSHNPRAVFELPVWNRDRLRVLAARIAGPGAVGNAIVYAGLTAVRGALAIVQALLRSVPRLWRRLPKRVFWRGEGNLHDPAHGGLETHYWIPRLCSAELERHRFRLLEVRPDSRVGHPLITRWYYYAFESATKETV